MRTVQKVQLGLLAVVVLVVGLAHLFSGLVLYGPLKSDETSFSDTAQWGVKLAACLCNAVAGFTLGMYFEQTLRRKIPNGYSLLVAIVCLFFALAANFIIWEKNLGIERYTLLSSALVLFGLPVTALISIVHLIVYICDLSA